MKTWEEAVKEAAHQIRQNPSSFLSAVEILEENDPRS